MAAVKKNKGLSDEEIGLNVDRKVRKAVGVSSSKLAKERENVLKYYNGESPKPQHKGQSSYVSTDVYDSVEAMKADLLETFGGSQDIGQFEPQGPNDVAPCVIATEYASYVIYRQNKGFHIFDDVIQDGLKARVGVVKVYWDEDKELQDETFEGQDEATVQALAEMEDVESLEAEASEEEGTYSGTLSRVKFDKSQVRIDTIAPENFGILPNAKSLDSFHYHLELLTKDEMKAMGLDVKKLKDLPPDASEKNESDLETEARFSPIDSGYSADDEDAQAGRYKVYECYDKFVKVKGDRARLYKVVLVGNKVLLCEEVDRSPFKVFVPLRVSHSFWGNNFGARVIPTQNARTVLTRGILDHTVITLNPRHTVLQGGLVNPREMLDNRLGGLVNISRPDALQPLMQPPLNPFVYQTIEMLKMNKEETTGTSSLAQGLNKDAVSNQNSQGMIGDLVDLSKQRAKVIARNFAMFLAELYEEVYRLVVENESRPKIAEIAGEWIEIDPSKWAEKRTFRVQFYLGSAAAEQEAQKLLSMGILAAQDPDLNRMFGSEGRYNMAQKVSRLRGVKDFNTYFTHPSKIPAPEPDPEIELRKIEAQTKIQVAQANAEKEKLKAQIEMIRMQHEAEMLKIELANAQAELELKKAESARKDAQVANEIDIAQREITIVEQAPTIEPAKAIVSPNS